MSSDDRPRRSRAASSSSSTAESRTHMLAGAIAGAAGALALQPLDVLKTRLQVRTDARPSGGAVFASAYETFRDIVRVEGARGAFAGSVPAMVGSAASWGAYLAWYDVARRRHGERFGRDEGGAVTMRANVLAATEAGIVTTALTNPIWVVKTRLQLQRGGGVGGLDLAGERRYRGFFDALWTIARTEGVRGLYKGFVPSVWLVSHGSVQLTAYEWLRERLASGRERDPRNGKRLINPTEAGALGLTSKFVAVSVTYPFQVVRARMQQRQDVPRPADAPSYTRFTRALALTVRREGVGGLYRGFAPNVLRVLPNSAVTFAAYEAALAVLHNH
ncbi:Mitochondrial substrate/solute carrier [Ostreococcus tauri]|uniref:Mitochondrial substrate/solute carrier n=1 Tax=Ostreococcus tauri TaxID=70448 RepID=A0A096P7I0_OSTTA|nr:Mitochondrial substrate/solute carrier [Ostreococcus tauri]CEG00171.1 Mitochondrial substrate/solute carrier [Ostreococcus tauri]|eukprot:XP_003082708.2 Mitochondrial substrate/solute carrier [Ostreococcus tauri]